MYSSTEKRDPRIGEEFQCKGIPRQLSASEYTSQQKQQVMGEELCLDMEAMHLRMTWERHVYCLQQDFQQRMHMVQQTQRKRLCLQEFQQPVKRMKFSTSSISIARSRSERKIKKPQRYIVESSSEESESNDEEGKSESEELTSEEESVSFQDDANDSDWDPTSVCDEND